MLLFLLSLLKLNVGVAYKLNNLLYNLKNMLELLSSFRSLNKVPY